MSERPKNSRYTAKRWWLRLHALLGLSVGVFFVLMGLTGSFLVWYKAADKVVRPEIYATAYDPSGPAASPDQMVASVEERMEKGDHLFRLLWPLGDEVSFRAATLSKTPSGEKEVRMYYLHPESGEVIDDSLFHSDTTDPSDWPLVFLVYRLHDSLLLGHKGEWLISWIAGLLAFSSISGLVLWRPRGGLIKSLGVSWKNKIKRHHDLHRVTGILSAALLLVLSVTGFVMSESELVEGWLKPLGLTDRRAPVKVEPPAEGMDLLPLLEVERAAHDRFPDSETWCLQFPPGPPGVLRPVQVVLRQEGEPGHGHGSTIVWLDPYRGYILKVADWNKAPLGDKIRGWIFPLHNGEAFGLAGRILVTLAGIAPLILGITGTRVWLGKRKKRKLAKSSSEVS